MIEFRAKVAEWSALRDELALLERSEHPDITDRHGRVWVWAGRGDLYVHDETVAIPKAWISTWGWPSSVTDKNPNYRKLCDICRRSAS